MSDNDFVPDDEPKSTIPDAVVTIEAEVKAEGEKVTVVEEKKPSGDAALDSAEEMAKNLRQVEKRATDAERKLNVSESARNEAETKLKTTQSKISAATQQNIDANRAAAANALELAKQRRDQAKKDYITLQSEGKFEEAFEATQVAAKASTEIEGAENYLVRLEQAVEQLANAPQEPEKPTDNGITDPVTGIRFTPKTYEWTQKHKDNWGDQDFRIECDAASRAAKKKGLSPDTDEYFEFVESRLQREGYLDAPEQTEDDEVDDIPEQKPEPKPQPVRKVSVSAAPTRSVPGTRSVEKKGVKLTGMEREIAKSLVDSLPEIYGRDANPDQIYAKNKLALQSEDER